ncbi:MAG: hypothetical protein NTY02_15950 [Acidobacteria bacterium]|nr:hypothetical protein [Acidobacteriota bacterium]
MRVRRRISDERGQSTSEYITLTGMVVSIAILVVNVLGVSVRLALQTAAQKMLSVITGYP